MQTLLSCPLRLIFHPHMPFYTILYFFKAKTFYGKNTKNFNINQLAVLAVEFDELLEREKVTAVVLKNALKPLS